MALLSTVMSSDNNIFLKYFMKPELKYCDNCALVFSAKKGQRFCSDGCRFEFHNAARAAANKSRDYITPEVKGYFQNIQILERLYNLKLQGPFSKEQLEKMNFQFDSLFIHFVTSRDINHRTNVNL